MNNKLLQFVKDHVMDETKTTKDLIYSDKIIDPHDIKGSYEKLVKANPQDWFIVPGPMKFGNDNLYMNLPKYNKINTIHNIVSNQINQVGEMEPSKKIKDFVESEIFNSLWIEGIRSSRKDIKQIVKSGITNLSDYKSKLIKNYNDALHFVFSTNDINENTLFALYTILTKDIDMGKEKLDGLPYRLLPVHIGIDEEGIDFSQIKSSMDSIFTFISQVEQRPASSGSDTGNILFSLIIHYLFELIHPYYDMNGRTGRLLTIWYAQKFNVSHHMMFLSEAINLFKKPLYYDAFDKTKEKDFKLDVNYFVASLSSALIAHKIITYILYELDNDLMSNKSVKLSSLQKIILQSLLAKDNKFYKVRDFILGHDDYNKGQVSIALKQLEEYGLLKVVNSKPKEYQLIWTKTINKSFKYITDLAIGIK